MQGYLCAPEDTPFLTEELRAAGFQTEWHSPGLLSSRSSAPPLPLAPVFLRQWLPDVRPARAESIRLWAEALVGRVREQVSAGVPWRLHVVPHYLTVNSTHAGENRCRLIREATVEQLGRQARQLLRTLQGSGAAPFTNEESLVQLVLTQPDAGWISVALAPLPAMSRRFLSPFSAGEIPVASDPAAPSRAFAKLLEAEIRLGRQIASRESCVDLGACPGSWSYVALRRGASVVAVDRAPVRDDLLRNPRLRFVQGDAFRYRPDQLVDWLICDVIAAPERSIQLVLDWVRARWCRHFVVTIKFKGHEEYARLELLKRELPGLTLDFGIARLCANKNEACVFGSALTV